VHIYFDEKIFLNKSIPVRSDKPPNIKALTPAALVLFRYGSGKNPTVNEIENNSKPIHRTRRTQSKEDSSDPFRCQRSTPPTPRTTPTTNHNAFMMHSFSLN
jgi:hypothetical protein